MAIREDVTKLVNELKDEQLQLLLSYGKFLKAETEGLLDIPKEETLAAIREVEEMQKNPLKYKKYTDVDEMMEDILNS